MRHPADVHCITGVILLRYKTNLKKHSKTCGLNLTPDPCEGCLTQDLTLSCTSKCSALIEGTLGDNLLNVIGGVSDEETCDRLCQEEDGCSVYTYHPAVNPTFPETCYLLTALQDPVRECEGDPGNTTCVTGLPNCEGSLCTFLEGGNMFPNGILATEEGERQIELLREAIQLKIYWLEFWLE